MEMTCDVEGCSQQRSARGWCVKHYNQWYRTGSVSLLIGNESRLSQGSPDAFWSRVERGGPDDCWPWKEYIGRAGYGTVKWIGKVSRAHRIAYLLANGPYSDDLFICHRCDNPPCCNPAHLYAGSPADNMRDRGDRTGFSGNATTRGVVHPKAKLNDESVLAIRQRFREGETSTTLGKEYGVHPSTIMQVVRRVTWTHLAEVGR